jgi:hypothetical protein
MKKVLTLCSIALSALAFAMPPSNFTPSEAQPSAWSESKILPRLSAGRILQLDGNGLRDRLLFAPVDRYGSYAGEPARITLPLADGTEEEFKVVEQPILSPELQREEPSTRTYYIQGVTDRTKTGRLSFTLLGFHGMILGGAQATYIDPVVLGDESQVVAYFKRDLTPANTMSCGVTTPDGDGDLFDTPGGGGYTLENNTGAVLQTYRLAMSATGEYSNFFGSTDGTGPALANAAVAASVNRVTGVYERDFAIRLNIVYRLCRTNGTTDPFSNNNGGTLLSQNQTALDGTPGNAAYDIGHIFSTGGGGVAYLNGVRNNTIKAGGVTGLGSPTGDAFDIDYVAHEMGHQFGGNHSFNSVSGSCGGGNRNASTAWETGSGTTIMAYAGICSPENVQNNSDAFFHVGNYIEVNATRIFFTNTPPTNSAMVATNTGNSPPVISSISANSTIPQSTAFRLTASATDTNGDALTYSWEQFDAGSPLFRSLNASTSGTRFFPPLANTLANTTIAWQTLPATNRTMNFKVSVRDNRAGGGGYAYNASNVALTVSGAAFVTNTPLAGATWNAGSSQTVTWTVGGTNAAAPVRILLSTDGGNSYATGGTTVLLASTPNDGTQTVQVPWVANTTTARVIIEPVTGVWFDPSPGNFTINESNQWSTANPGSTNAGTVGNGAVNLTGPAGTGGVAFTLTSLNTAAATVPATVTVPQGNTTVTVPITVAPTASTGNVTINVTRNGTTKAIVIPIVANSAPIAGNDSYNVAYGSSTTVAAPGVLGNDSDPNGTAITAQLVTGPIKGSLALNANGSFTYTANLGQTGADSFTYRVSDGSLTSNTATVSLTIAAFPRISGTVELQSFIPDESGRIAAFELRAPGGTTSLGTYAAVLGTGGAFNFAITNRAPGTYDLLIKDSTFLRGRVSNVVLSSNGGISSASFSLINGDVDGDNEVSILDYIEVSNAYDTQVGDPGYSAAADLDKDGFVSILDYLIVSTNYELQGVN